MDGFFLSLLLFSNSLTVDLNKLDETLREVTGPFPSSKSCEIYFHGSFTKSELSGHIKNLKFWNSKKLMFADFEVVKGSDSGKKILAAGKCEELRTP